MAQYYEEFFPLSSAQTEFIISRIGNRTEAAASKKPFRLLDVGCAVGDLAAAVAAAGVEVDAVDLNAAMIRRARERHGDAREGEGIAESTERNTYSPPRFHEMDMLEIDRHFSPQSFDSLTCLGNTLVHLPGPAAIEGFLQSAALILKDDSRRHGGEAKRGREKPPGGKVILQILNYDHLLAQRPEELSPLETEHVRFERRYRYSADLGGEPHGCITFQTRLEMKAGEEVFENSVGHYPLRRAELETLLRRAGFDEPALYGGFDGSPLHADSFPLIAVARLR